MNLTIIIPFLLECHLKFAGMNGKIFFIKEKKYQHLGELVKSSLKQNIWWEKTLHQKKPKLKFISFFLITEEMLMIT